jgi:hypothetical protein
LPYDTDVTALFPEINLSAGATISPNTSTAQDFTNTVTYTVTAEDGETTQDWVVTVTAALNTAADIISFVHPNQQSEITINTTDHLVNIDVPFGTDITSLVPLIIISGGATMSPANGITQNFTNPVTYTVTAEDGVTVQDWVVTVTAALNIAADILTFNFSEQSSSAIISACPKTP